MSEETKEQTSNEEVVLTAKLETEIKKERREKVKSIKDTIAVKIRGLDKPLWEYVATTDDFLDAYEVDSYELYFDLMQNLLDAEANERTKDGYKYRVIVASDKLQPEKGKEDGHVTYTHTFGGNDKVCVCMYHKSVGGVVVDKKIRAFMDSVKYDDKDDALVGGLKKFYDAVVEIKYNKDVMILDTFERDKEYKEKGIK